MQDMPALPSQGSRGIRKNRKSKDRRRCGDSLLGPDVTCSLRYKAHLVRKAALRVKPVFSPARAAEEGPLYTSAEHSVTELHIWSMYTPFSFTCVDATAHVWGSEDHFVELGLSW